MRINALGNTATDFASDDYIAIDGSTNGSRKMKNDSLLKLTAQNALAGNVAPAFDPTRTNDNPYKSGESVAYDGKVYTFKVDHYGAWADADAYTPFALSCIVRARAALEDTILAKSFEIEKKKICNNYDDRNSSITNLAVAPFVINFDFSKYVISSLGLKINSTGTLSIGICKKIPTNGEAFSSSDIENLFVVNVDNAGYNVIDLPEPITIPSNYRLCVSSTTDTATFNYGPYNEGPTNWLYVNHGSGIYVSGTTSIGINIFGYDISKITNNLNYLFENVKGEHKTIIEGYSADNVTAGTFTTSPYVLDQSLGKDFYLDAIKINVRGAGVVSVGTVKKSDIVIDASVDYTDFNVKETFTVSQTGVIELKFTDKVKVKSDEYIFVGLPSDTLTFYYGANGIDKGFVYVNSGVYKHSPSSVNVDIKAFIPLDAYSTYNGKTISILGDSISTFQGYIPVGNLTYYPSGTVQSVKDTWWKKLIDALGLVLDVNNSWSGSRVTTTAGETSAGCGDRAEALGTSPDIIIVWMGINDFNNEVDLGTYDGKSAIPATTTTFREAYGIMLNKILTNYPKSEVYVCTLPQCERNGSSGFPEVNGNGVPLVDYNIAIEELARAFGVKVLDHNRCGLTYQNMSVYNPDQLHPNKYGHSLLANNDISQLDNFVRTRYPIE